MIHARTVWVRGTAACSSYPCYRRDRVHSGCAVSTFPLPLAACPSGARRVPRRHMDTAPRRQAREAQGWLVKQVGDLRVCVCMCVERREYVRASKLEREARTGTLRSGLYRAVVSTCNSVGRVAVVATASPYNQRGERERGSEAGNVYSDGRVRIRGVAAVQYYVGG